MLGRPISSTTASKAAEQELGGEHGARGAAVPDRGQLDRLADQAAGQHRGAQGAQPVAIGRAPQRARAAEHEAGGGRCQAPAERDRDGVVQRTAAESARP